jgi:hypothetical protein
MLWVRLAMLESSIGGSEGLSCYQLQLGAAFVLYGIMMPTCVTQHAARRQLLMDQSQSSISLCQALLVLAASSMQTVVVYNNSLTVVKEDGGHMVAPLLWLAPGFTLHACFIIDAVKVAMVQGSFKLLAHAHHSSLDKNDFTPSRFELWFLQDRSIYTNSFAPLGP